MRCWGQKVTIVTPKPQTTRNQIVGIHTDETAQDRLHGYAGPFAGAGAAEQGHAPGRVAEPQSGRRHHARAGQTTCTSAIPTIWERDLAPVAEALASETRPMIVVVNKVDLFADKSRMLPLLTRLSEMWPSAEIFPVSALMKDGLPALMELIRSRLPEGEAQFPDDQISTAPGALHGGGDHPREALPPAAAGESPTASPWRWSTGKRTSKEGRPSSTRSSM